MKRLFFLIVIISALSSCSIFSRHPKTGCPSGGVGFERMIDAMNADGNPKTRDREAERAYKNYDKNVKGN
ncbi:MAG: hypothetical protein FGM46_00775 [Ferruginibacter sp.]|nr:hypothetical protein [Ferruginibacter sp.]